jgi:trehalose-6-phosphate synthase
MDSAIRAALDMPVEERRGRMTGLRKAVLENDVRKWTPGTLALARPAVAPAA